MKLHPGLMYFRMLHRVGDSWTQAPLGVMAGQDREGGGWGLPRRSGRCLHLGQALWPPGKGPTPSPSSGTCRHPHPRKGHGAKAPGEVGAATPRGQHSGVSWAQSIIPRVQRQQGQAGEGVVAGQHRALNWACEAPGAGAGSLEGWAGAPGGGPDPQGRYSVLAGGGGRRGEACRPPAVPTVQPRRAGPAQVSGGRGLSEGRLGGPELGGQALRKGVQWAGR